jgi:hypothetical protein
MLALLGSVITLRLKRHGGGLLLMLCQKSFAARPHGT